MTDLRIEAAKRCEYCHPETCSCPDFYLMLGVSAISSGDIEHLKQVKEAIENYIKVNYKPRKVK